MLYSSVSEAAFTTLCFVKCVYFKPFSLLVAGYHHLGNAFAVGDCKRFA